MRAILLFLLALGLNACSGPPVIVNAAKPAKAVNTAPVRLAIASAKSHADKAEQAIAKAQEEAVELPPLQKRPLAVRDALSVSNASPDQAPTASSEAGPSLAENLSTAKAEVEGIKDDLQKAETGRAIAQEQADTEHAANADLVKSVNDAKGEIASLSKRVDTASERGTVYRNFFFALFALNALYAVLKFYLHLPI
jgi:hypothetical protein